MTAGRIAKHGYSVILYRQNSIIFPNNECRLLKTFNGALSLDDILEKLAPGGHHYSAKDARTILAKAAQAGLVLGTKFGIADHLREMKHRIQAAKKGAAILSCLLPVCSALQSGQIPGKNASVRTPDCEPVDGILLGLRVRACLLFWRLTRPTRIWLGVRRI